MITPKPPVGITELVQTLGDERIQMQPLNAAITNMRRLSDHNRFEFGTTQEFGLQGPEQVGLILWVKREDLADAKQKLGID